MKKRVKKLIVAFALTISFMGASYMSSARNIGGYSTNLERFGVVAYTDSLQKTNQSRAVNNNDYVGGGYNMFSVISRDGQDLTDEVKQKSGDRVMLVYNAPWNEVGNYVKLKYYSHWTDYVRIHVEGSWSPDEYE